jgi:hypothetical protein
MRWLRLAACNAALPAVYSMLIWAGRKSNLPFDSPRDGPALTCCNTVLRCQLQPHCWFSSAALTWCIPHATSVLTS